MKAQEMIKKLFFVAGCAALVCAVNVTDSQAANTTASASGKVIAPMTITKTTDLNFGNFAAGLTGGTVALTTDGINTRSKTGGVTLASGGTVAAAVFGVTGEANATYAITMLPLTLTGSGGGTMAVTLASTPSGTGTLSAGGSGNITVAGSLDVGAGQTAGTYTGTLDVTVDYN